MELTFENFYKVPFDTAFFPARFRRTKCDAASDVSLDDHAASNPLSNTAPPPAFEAEAGTELPGRWQVPVTVYTSIIVYTLIVMVYASIMIVCVYVCVCVRERECVHVCLCVCVHVCAWVCVRMVAGGRRAIPACPARQRRDWR